MISKIRKREKAAYPSYMRQMQRFKKWSDLTEYCESDQVKVHLLGKKGYVIMTPYELVDLVAEPRDIFKALAVIKAYYGNRPFSADFRETTSWRLAQMAQRRGKIQLSDVDNWSWGTETMFSAEVRFS